MSAGGGRRLLTQLAPGYARDGTGVHEVRAVEASLARYRVMAWVVGTGLAILVLVGVPLQYGAGLPQVDAVVGPIHGVLYLVYLVAAAGLARRARFTLGQLLAMVGAGFVPLLAFVVEHRVTLRLHAELAAVRSEPEAGGRD